MMHFHQKAKNRKIVNCKLLKYVPNYAHINVKKLLLPYFILKEHNNVNNDGNNISLIEQTIQ